MIVLLTGERYLCEENIKNLKNAIEFPEMNYLRTREWSDEAMEFVCSSPMLSDKRVIVADFGSITQQTKGYKELTAYVKNPFVTTDLYILCKKIDKRTELYKEIKASHKIKDYKKLTPGQVYEVFVNRLKENGIEERDVLPYKTLLIDRLGFYYKDSEKSILDIHRCADCVGTLGYINESVIDFYISATPNQQIFDLAKLLLGGDEVHTWELLNELMESGIDAFQIVGALRKTIRICYKATMYEGTRNEILKKIGADDYQLPRRYTDYSNEQYGKIYNTLQEAEQALKTGANKKNTIQQMILSCMKITES